MKPSKLTLGLALAALLLGASISESALAHGRGGARLSLGFHFGGPAYWGPWPYYGYPAYYPYYPAPVVVQSPPQVYVERDSAPVASAPEAGYWYYCAATRGYYPYVKECPGGWQKVAPTPQN
jgi:hypothetical protein